MKKVKEYFINKFLPAVKEWARKKMVTLKRKPHYIPLLMLIISCLVFNLKLTSYSDTVALINEPGMGVVLFVVVLCSFLSIIGFLTAFPNRQKPKIISIILVCIMIVIQIVGQVFLNYFIRYGTELKAKPVEITKAREFVLVAKSNSIIHIVFNIICLLIIITLPLYSKLLKKINTSIKVEDVHIDGLELIEDDEVL